jgi:hypothetical protein
MTKKQHIHKRQQLKFRSKEEKIIWFEYLLPLAAMNKGKIL